MSHAKYIHQLITLSLLLIPLIPLNLIIEQNITD